MAFRAAASLERHCTYLVLWRTSPFELFSEDHVRRERFGQIRTHSVPGALVCTLWHVGALWHESVRQRFTRVRNGGLRESVRHRITRVRDGGLREGCCSMARSRNAGGAVASGLCGDV